MQSGYKGISFPFRISKQGGVVMSTTSQHNSKHIEESMKQILNTHFLERTMESEIYSQLDTDLFETNDEGLQAIMREQIVEDFERLEERITVEEDDISFSIEKENGIDMLYITIVFVVDNYETQHVVKVGVGDK